ncbi:MAG: TonB-dependent receptor, partial [Sphingomonadales bacterium]|nr:TonB-dependent receptor [Sphingomonadales bacterium]
RDVPGVAVSALPGQTQIRLRGSEANHVLVLVDGIEVSDPFAGEFDLSGLFADPAARVEVLRGQQSALYGSDAIGGVVQYITASGREAPGIAARIEAGSFATINAAVRAAGTSGAFDYALTGSWNRSDGTPGTRGGTRDLGSDNRSVALKAGVDIGAAARVSTVLRYAHSAGDFNSPDADPASPAFGLIVDTPGQRFENEGHYALLRGEVALLDGRWSNALTVQVADSSRDGYASGGRSSGSEGTRTKGSFESTLRFGTQTLRHRLTVAVDAERESARNTDPTGFASTARRNFDNLGLVGEYEAAIGTRAVIGAALRHDVNGSFADVTTFRLNASLRVAAATRLHAAFGTGVKNPGFYELYSYFDGLFIGNPGLTPETSTGWEAGVEQRFAGDRVVLGATWFENRLTDEIFIAYPPPSFVGTPGNRADVSRQRGLELTAQARPGGGFRIDGAYTYLHAREAGVEEVRRPRHVASIAFDWAPDEGPVGANLVARYTGRQRDVAFTDPSYVPVPVTLDAYLLVNASVRYRFGERAELIARVENLADADYEDVYSYATPGRAVYAGIRARF